MAARFAPLIMLQKQSSRCDTEGEAFLPAPVEVVFADNTVTLREGPQQIAAKSPVENTDLFNLGSEFATDLPGSPREPDCAYEKHFKAVMGDQRPVIYAHIATEEGKPGIALQYWFFYYFNQFNNLHEGDWEMIQLLFNAGSVEEALTQQPVSVGFAQHDSGEIAAWDSPKLDREGDRPLVYASRGSHASQFGPGLWLGWGQDGSGLGCDVTSGQLARIDPEVRLIPATISGPDDPFAWVTFSGRWGERESWVYNGPTGPALKPRWTSPVTWMEGLRADALRVNSSTVLGPAPSSIFCDVVEGASTLLTLSKPYPLLVGAGVGLGLALAIAIVRVSRPTLRATWRVYRQHFRVLALLGAITVPLTLVASFVSYALGNSPRAATLFPWSEDSAEILLAMEAVSLLQRLILLILVTPAVMHAMRAISLGEAPGVRRSLRDSMRTMQDYLWTIARAALVVLALTFSVFGIPWAINREGRWLFGAQVAIFDGLRGKAALERSAAIIKGSWWQTVGVLAMLLFVSAAPGTAVALLGMIALRFPIDAANSLASIVYALSQVFAIAGMTMLYLQRRRGEGGEGGRGEVN